MIEQNVQLVRCEGERMWVRLGSQSGCSACDNGNGCGAGLFAKLVQRKPLVIELARNDLSAVPGQMLTLAFPEQVYMKLVLAYYGWPLLAALVGAIAGQALAVWLQFGPGLIDVATLSGGLLAAGGAMAAMKKGRSPEVVLKSLQATVCYPSSTPNMCSRKNQVASGSSNEHSQL